MKRVLSALMAAAMCAITLTACAGEGTGSAEGSSAASVATTGGTGTITVISREDGSGTRGAFVELFGVEEKDENGDKVDRTTDDAEISNSTEVMIQSVAGNTAAIGYISLGSLDDTVKALEIDGAQATVENIKSGEYKVSRPFNVATMGENISEAAQDFLAYIMSAEGQAVVADSGYIGDDSAAAYSGTKPAGKITISGSSSVSPLMEKLIEAYQVVNPDADIELQTSDSTTGMTNAIDGMCDIGMASRELKDEELEAGLVNTVIATDGIAVIVNNDAEVDGLTSDQVKGIYTGEITDWSQLG